MLKMILSFLIAVLTSILLAIKTPLGIGFGKVSDVRNGTVQLYVYIVFGNFYFHYVKCIDADGHAVRLISIPRFSETSTIVLLDIHTTECFTLQFNIEENTDVDH